jgi:DNA-binding MarR family transcriptional regulator
MAIGTHYYPNFNNLLHHGVSRLGKDLFELLFRLSRKTGSAYISRTHLAEQLKCAKGSISRLVTFLEEKGFIKRTGKFKSLLFPLIEITKFAQKILFKAGDKAQINCDTPITQALPKQINNIQLKETTNSEKNVVVENLTKFGIAKNQAKRLKLKYPQELIAKQVEHLNRLLSSNTNIKNPAGWLIKAIQNNFAIKIEEQPITPIINHLETQDKLKQAAKEQAMQDARKTISDEDFNKLYQEELNKLTNSLQKFGIVSIAQHHKEAAHYNAMERLV